MRFFLLLMLLLAAYSGHTQDLEQIGQGPPVRLSGSVGGQTVFYNANGIQNRRDPFYWLLNANLNINIYGIDIPLSAVFSQQNRTFTQPFNQYGISPRYKAVTAHLGYRSLDFSDFTLSGNIFFGAGVEVAPEGAPIRVSALYGRFTRAITQGGAVGLLSSETAYERWGYGAKVSLGKALNRTTDLIVFRARDQEDSVPDSLAAASAIAPAENLVLGVNTRQQLAKGLEAQVEYAYSAFTTDVRLDPQRAEGLRVANMAGQLFTPNLSSRFNSAIQAGLTYQRTKYQLRVGYRRIGPEYKTLGSVFLNNDLEDYSLGVNFRALADRLSMSVTGGLQRNNLSRQLASDMTRLTTAVSGSYTASEKLSLNFNFSNFNSATRVLAAVNDLSNPTLRVDSLQLLQVTNNAGLGANYMTGTKTHRQMFMLSANYQLGNDQAENKTAFYNLNAIYQYAITPLQLNLNLGLNYNFNDMTAFSSSAWGPTLSVSKAFFDRRMRCSLASTLQSARSNSNPSGTNASQRVAVSYKVGKNHLFNADANYLARRAAPDSGGKSFSEFRAGMAYQYTF